MDGKIKEDLNLVWIEYEIFNEFLDNFLKKFRGK
jgi:hypothetical protein